MPRDNFRDILALAQEADSVLAFQETDEIRDGEPLLRPVYLNIAYEPERGDAMGLSVNDGEKVLLNIVLRRSDLLRRLS